MAKNNQRTLLNRDLSTLSFNQRVLALAQREDYPLLERLRFLCIVASNLDELFEVRMIEHLEAMRKGDSQGAFTAQSYHEVSEKAQELVAQQYRLFAEELMPALEKSGVSLISGHLRSIEQKRWVAKYFQSDVKPLLIPVALDPSHPFPQVANKSLNFIVHLAGKSKSAHKIAIVRVPRALPRIIRMPDRLSDKKQCFVSLTSVIRAHLDDLFVGEKILHYSQFRVTRNSDLSVDDDDVMNLRTALRQELAHRAYGEAVRLEVTADCQNELAEFLLEQFSLPESALYRVKGPVNLGRLIQLPDLAATYNSQAKNLIFAPYTPAWPSELNKKESILEQLKQRDILIHQPFESFEAVLDLLQEAVEDDNVLAIRQTIYRTGSDTRLLKLLQEAVRRGKEVLVVVELKARFDEESNINWAESLESIGAQVVYGIVGLKTHAKMLLILRREGKVIRRYAHLSTGNYNPRTAKLYTDMCMLTSSPTLTQEMEYLFRHLTSQLPLAAKGKLLVAPFNLHSNMLRLIRAAKAAVTRGQTARIIIKVNALTDEALVLALMDAAKAGVEVDIIARGACILPVDTPALQGRIRVRSVIGRFLEHSRVYYFEINSKISIWLSSADWMSRNMLRRIEVAWPILDEAMQKRVINESLTPYLQDNQDAWVLSENGKYVPAKSQKPTETKAISAQNILMQTHRSH